MSVQEHTPSGLRTAASIHDVQMEVSEESTQVKHFGSKHCPHCILD